ncbi:MAG: 3-oxoacid CoA-transferase subunit A [Candidatus Cloacimonetes bacterium]|nr:3-oxoacid CoA-transferase subunit A [Candidatus Cloacimonadota bacterium]
MPEIVSVKEAAALVKPGSSILFGGFLAVGCTENLIDALKEIGTKDLEIIVIATDYEDRGVGILIANKQVAKIKSSHIGTNKATQAQMNNGEIKVDLIPQGTLLEQIRAAGAGLGGVLTPTGLGTVVAEGKQIIVVDDKQYLLEKPISANFAFIRAAKADRYGNLIYSKTARNSNPIMATAGKITIAEVDEILEVGEISPEDVVTPGVFVDYLVLHKEG